MKATLPNIRKLGFRPGRDRNDGLSDNPENVEPAEIAPEPPKPPPDLNLFFMLSHLEHDGPVRLDGVKLAVSGGHGAGAGQSPSWGPSPVP